MLAGNMLLKIIARLISDYIERVGILPKEQRGFRSTGSTVDMGFLDNH